MGREGKLKSVGAADQDLDLELEEGNINDVTCGEDP